MEATYTYSPAQEKDIIQKILGGEKALFEVLIRRTNAALYKIARVYGFNHQDAEDLMQDTHIAAFLNLGSFQYRSSYKTWISKIMIHKCQYKLKHGYTNHEKPQTENITERAQPINYSGMPSTDKAIFSRELSRILEEGIQRIPLHYRTVFVLRDIEGYSVSETAELLQLSQANVKVRLSRARIMVQTEVEKYYSKAEIYSFQLCYCDPLTDRVMKQVMDL